MLAGRATVHCTIRSIRTEPVKPSQLPHRARSLAAAAQPRKTACELNRAFCHTENTISLYAIEKRDRLLQRLR